MATIDERIINSKKILGEKIQCSLETLTPVHVGSGRKLASGIDFIKTDYSIHIVPQSELLSYLEKNPDEMENFIKGNYKLGALNRMPEGRTYYLQIGRTNEIIEFERNGFGKPYIPGSSIKGAIRTILLRKRLDELSENERTELFSSIKKEIKKKIENNQRPKREWASQDLLKKIFGNSSNNNLMRVLEIFDAEFNELDLDIIYILSLTSENGDRFGWKNLWNRRNENKIKFATQLVAETLPIGSKTSFSIVLNKFLINNKTANELLNFSEDALKEFANLAKTVNKYSNEYLSKEKKFFDKLQKPQKLSSFIQEIENLISIINSCKENEMVLRISWGGGWKSMIGDYLDDKWLKYFRSEYKLGKKDFEIFPKTRKIIFDEDEPKYLPGWIKVKFFDQYNSKKDSQNSTIAEREEGEPDFSKLSNLGRVTKLKK